MKKYLFTMATLALFVIGFAASDEDESSNSTSQNEQSEMSEQKQEEKEIEEIKKINPFERFIGKYVLYDDEGGKGQTFIVASDGRFLQDNGDDFLVTGKINPQNDQQFEVSLSEKIFGIRYVWSYKNNHTCTQAWDISRNNILLFDLNEKKMYIDINEYNNRDYTNPEYYKFRFAKQ